MFVYEFNKKYLFALKIIENSKHSIQLQYVRQLQCFQILLKTSCGVHDASFEFNERKIKHNF